MSDPYAEVKAHFAEVEGVTVNSGRGAQGLKLGNKMFAMFYKGDLLVRLAPERVSELVVSGEGLVFDPGTGTPMAHRVLVAESRRDDWISLCEESRRFAESHP
jgi:hypothetical protein